MKLISRLRAQCYCAYCKSPRRVYVKKHIDLTNVAGALLLALGAGFTLFGRPDPRALVLFCLTLVVSEVLVYLRWRNSLACRMCGFDPLIYKKSPARAAALVKEFFEEKRESPGFMLSRSPLLEKQKEQNHRQRKARDYKSVEAKMLARRPANPANTLAPPKGP